MAPADNGNLQPRARRRRLFPLIIVVVLVIAGGVALVKHGRHYVLPKRFAIVEPGALYRSGYCEPGPLTGVIRKYGIRTILVLLDNDPNSADQQKEEDVARQEGVKIIRIAGMPGDGCADFDLIDRAAHVIADPAHRPLLVHCSAGVNRTGIAYAAWRMKYCGWDDERALAEAVKYGYSPLQNPTMREHLRQYYRSRIASSRPTTNNSAER